MNNVTITNEDKSYYFPLVRRADETSATNEELKVNNTNTTSNGTGIQDFSIAMVPEDSSVLIAHSVCCYLFSFIVMFFLWKNYRLYARYLKENICKGGIVRTRAIKTEVLQSKTVMIRNLPTHIQDKYSLMEWFNNLKIGRVQDVHVFYEINTKLANAMAKRRDTLYNLEKAYLSYKNNIDKNAQEKNFVRRFLEKKVLKKFPNSLNNLFNPVNKENNDDPELQKKKTLRKLRPSHFTGTLFPLNGKFVDSISTYEADLEKYTNMIKELRDEEFCKEATPNEKKRAFTAFVTFKDTRSAHIVSQLNLYTSNNKNTMECSAAPNPTNLQWENLHYRVEKKKSMSIVVTVALFFMCIYYMVPIPFILAFTELENLMEVEFLKSFLYKIKDYELVRTFFENVLPSLLVNVLLSLIPIIIYFLTKFEYFESVSMREKSFLKKYYLFILFNILFVCSLSKAFWGILFNAINNPQTIVSLLGEKLPKGANFFIIFIIYRIQGPASELASIAGIAIGWLKRKFLFKTKRQIWDYEHTTDPLNYGLVYPLPLLIFTIISVYSCISSLIMIPGILYFFVAYINQKNNILYRNVKRWENNGVYYNLIFNRIIFALLISQLTLIGMFSTKQPYLTISLIPLVVITILFCHFCHGNFATIHENTPIDQFVDGQAFENCKSNLLSSLYDMPKEGSEDGLDKSKVRRTSTMVSISKEDLRNCMQDAIDSDLRDNAILEDLKDKLDNIVKTQKEKEDKNHLAIPKKTATMDELKTDNNNNNNKSASKTPENNYGANEYIYITAQKKRKSPQYSCLAESELPQIPIYYLAADYNHPDMTSGLYSPWMPEGLDESLIERYDKDTKPDDHPDNAVIDVKEDKDDKNGEDSNVKILKESDDSTPGIMVSSPDEVEFKPQDNMVNNPADDDDQPLVNNVTVTEEPKQPPTKPKDISIDVNNLDFEDDDNIYKSLPNSAESPMKNALSEEPDSANPRTSIYLDA